MNKIGQSSAKSAPGSRNVMAANQADGAASDSMVSPGARARKSSKGARTRARVVCAALAMAKRDGLSSITFARLADTLHMSRSGIFARFGSIEALQTAVVARYISEFKRTVLYPALRHPPGLLRLETVFERWVAYSGLSNDAGCLWMRSLTAMKYGQDTTRRALQVLEHRWHETLHALIRQAIAVGQLGAACDPKTMIFEMQALVLAVHHKRYFLGTVNTSRYVLLSFQRLLHSYGEFPPKSSVLGRRQVGRAGVESAD